MNMQLNKVQNEKGKELQTTDFKNHKTEYYMNVSICECTKYYS